MFLVGHAKGVQIYKCDGNGTWGFVRPPGRPVRRRQRQAHLKHFAGPTWKATAGSSAVSRHGDARDPTALARDSDGFQLAPAPGTAAYTSRGGDLLARHDLHPAAQHQGRDPPPAAECKAQTVDKVKEVPYKADYYFWKVNGAPDRAHRPAEWPLPDRAGAAIPVVTLPGFAVTLMT